MGGQGDKGTRRQGDGVEGVDGVDGVEGVVKQRARCSHYSLLLTPNS